MDGWNGKKSVAGILEFGLDCSASSPLDGEPAGAEGKLATHESCPDAFVHPAAYLEARAISTQNKESFVSAQPSACFYSLTRGGARLSDPEPVANDARKPTLFTLLLTCALEPQWLTVRCQQRFASQSIIGSQPAGTAPNRLSRVVTATLHFTLQALGRLP